MNQLYCAMHRDRRIGKRKSCETAEDDQGQGGSDHARSGNPTLSNLLIDCCREGYNWWYMEIGEKLSTSAQHEMDTTVGRNHVADFANIQPISSIFERFLHLPVAKPSKIASIRVRRAVGMQAGKFSKLSRRSIDLSLITSQDLDGLFLSTRNVLL